MGSNFTVFESAVSALASNSTAISIAAQNIANVNTPGYSRQYAVMSSRAPQNSGGSEVGRGVDIIGVKRIYDAFAESRLRASNSSRGRYSALASNLQQDESVFNEIGKSGLAEYLGAFFNSFGDLANDPTSLTARNSVLSKATILVDRFRSLDQSLRDARRFIDGDVQNAVTQINTLANDIADINNKIRDATADESLVFNDQRTVKIKELAEFVDVSVVESEGGDFILYAAGVPLVSGTNVGTFSLESDAGNDNLNDVVFSVTNGGSETSISDRITSGSLKGFFEVRDSNIPDYMDQLDELAYRLVSTFNTAHNAGYSMAGNTGLDFFQDLGSATDAASLISLDSDVLGLPENLAAAGSAAEAPGGNTVALTLAAFDSTTVTFDSGNYTFVGFYGDFLSTIGAETGSALNQASFSEDIYTQASIARERISGVSLDEEQLDLVKFQSAFEASAKLVQIASDILERLSNLV
jgi:flagellar hook-associated protein 1 FlgK